MTFFSSPVLYNQPIIYINFIATGLWKESYSKGPAALGSYTNQEKANNIVQLVVVVAEPKSNNLHNVFCTLDSFWLKGLFIVCSPLVQRVLLWWIYVVTTLHSDSDWKLCNGNSRRPWIGPSYAFLNAFNESRPWKSWKIN